jgi:hypothetical protein
MDFKTVTLHQSLKLTMKSLLILKCCKAQSLYSPYSTGFSDDGWNGHYEGWAFSRREINVIWFSRVWISRLVLLVPTLSDLTNTRSLGARWTESLNLNQPVSIEQKVAPAPYLNDGRESSISLTALLTRRALLFKSIWTEQEGGGRTLGKGTGRPISDPSQPLTGSRAFNRVSAPDAKSSTGCHNDPFGIPGGAGDFVTNVFVLGECVDFINRTSSERT